MLTKQDAWVAFTPAIAGVSRKMPEAAVTKSGTKTRGRVFGDVGRGDTWEREIGNVWGREIGDAGT